MNIIGIVGTALIAAIFAVTLKRYNQEYAVIISIIAGVVILVEILRNISPAVREITTLLSGVGLTQEYGLILFKTLSWRSLRPIPAGTPGRAPWRPRWNLQGRSPFLCSPCRCLRILRRRPLG